jgi:hypothetical protein
MYKKGSASNLTIMRNLPPTFVYSTRTVELTGYPGTAVTRESPSLTTPVCVLEFASVGGSCLRIFDVWEGNILWIKQIPAGNGYPGQE